MQENITELSVETLRERLQDYLNVLSSKRDYTIRTADARNVIPCSEIISPFVENITKWVAEPKPFSDDHKKALVFSITACQLVNDLLKEPNLETLNEISQKLTTIKAELPPKTSIGRVLGGIVLALATLVTAFVEMMYMMVGPSKNWTKSMAAKTHRMFTTPAHSALDIVTELHQQAMAVKAIDADLEQKKKEESVRVINPFSNS